MDAWPRWFLAVSSKPFIVNERVIFSEPSDIKRYPSYLLVDGCQNYYPQTLANCECDAKLPTNCHAAPSTWSKLAMTK